MDFIELEQETLENFFHSLSDMTLNNPIFIFVLITVIWFLPGIIVRRISNKKSQQIRINAQIDAISKLYPKKNKE